jgi:hypothetical protein
MHLLIGPVINLKIQLEIKIEEEFAQDETHFGISKTARAR